MAMVVEKRQAFTAWSKKIDHAIHELEDEVEGLEGVSLRRKMHKKKMDLPEGVDYEQVQQEQFEQTVHEQLERHRQEAIEEATNHGHGHHVHDDEGKAKVRRGSIGVIPPKEVAHLGHRGHVVVTGRCPKHPEEQLAPKEVAMCGLGAIEEMHEDHMAVLTSLKGSSPALIRPNQDDFFFAVTADSYRIMCLLDGHGEQGHTTAAEVRDFILRTLLAEMPFERDPDEEVYHHQVATAMKDAFKAAHEHLVHQKEIDVKLSGVSVTVVAHDVKVGHLHVAWVGNTKALIADLVEEGFVEGGKRKGPVKKNLTAAPLTTDHTTKNHQEKDRVLRAGAELGPPKGDICELLVPGERLPGIPLTRCLGNKVAHAIGVTHEPNVLSRPVNSPGRVGRFVVMGTDGLWDVVRNSEAVITVHESRKGNLEFALQSIHKKAQEAWVKKSSKCGNVIDDVTVGLLWLHGIGDPEEPEGAT